MKKPFIIMIVLLLVIVIGGVVAAFLLTKEEPEPKEETENIDLILERSVETEKITTSLKDGTFAQVSFKIQTDSTETKYEVEKRMYQVNNIVINYFTNKTAADITENDGISTLQETLKTKVNEVLSNGEVEKVYTTTYVLQ